jgi:hypothetical protein
MVKGMPTVAVELTLRQMRGHGSQFGRKKERSTAALLTQRNLEECAKATGISPNTLLSQL